MKLFILIFLIPFILYSSDKDAKEYKLEKEIKYTEESKNEVIKSIKSLKNNHYIKITYKTPDDVIFESESGVRIAGLFCEYIIYKKNNLYHLKLDQEAIEPKLSTEKVISMVTKEINYFENKSKKKKKKKKPNQKID